MYGRMPGSSYCFLALIVAGSASLVEAAEPVAGVSAEAITYESHVRPILKTHCFHCHGEAGELAGGLDLRLRRLIAQGGDSGAAVVAGAPQESLLWQRLADGDMPPEEVATRPTPAEIEIVAQWIANGAVATQAEPLELDPDLYITLQERSYWAFQPVNRPKLPSIQAVQRPRTAIDYFIMAKLEPAGLTLSPDAPAEVLIRRVTQDLLGLPPTPAEVAAFVNDRGPDAYERLVERLLASPHYGERWGQHWLDVAGYADSEGYTEDDPERPHAFHYRDYVIQAWNADKPYDQFLIEQLAGDELLTPPLDNLTPQQAEKLIATGFLRTAPDGSGTSGVDVDLARNDMMAKTIEIVSSAVMGLTVACAQCHNHRYDPILQEDYYALRAILEPSLNWSQWQPPAKRHISLYTDADRAAAAEIEARAQQVLATRTEQEQAAVEATFERELAKLPAELQPQIRQARQTPEAERTAEQKQLLGEHPTVNVTPSSLYLYDQAAADQLKKLADEAAAIRATKPAEQFVRAAWEPIDQPLPPTHLFHRGDYKQAQHEVKPRTLTVLTSAQSSPLATDDPHLPTSGRRLAFAKWLTSGEHPLVARVIVNRVWLNHFGRGLVATPGDFGALGEPPTHPELLDWLAAELVDSGWSIKHLQRQILLSSTYRQSSSSFGRGAEIDQANQLLWRMPVRRLQAEQLRDTTLAISGELISRAFGPPIPVMPDPVGQFVIGIENSSAGRPGEVIPMHGEDLRRSIYVQVRRTRPLSVLVPFDYPRMEPNCTLRSQSTDSTQSLMMVNSQFVVSRGEQLAARLMREAPHDLAAQIQRGWQLVYSAPCPPQALQAAQEFIEQQQTHFATNPLETSDKSVAATPAAEALASWCHALLSSNRFLYID